MIIGQSSVDVKSVHVILGQSSAECTKIIGLFNVEKAKKKMPFLCFFQRFGMVISNVCFY